MTATEVPPQGAPERRLPPVASAAVVSLGLMVVGGITMASYVPRRPALALPVVLLVAGAALLVGSLVALARIKEFAWRTFFLVAKWALVAYVVSAGMIEFAFVRNHTRGSPLAVVTAMLVVFALDVPLIIAFTVARYATPDA